MFSTCWLLAPSCWFFLLLHFWSQPDLWTWKIKPIKTFCTLRKVKISLNTCWSRIEYVPADPTDNLSSSLHSFVSHHTTQPLYHPRKWLVKMLSLLLLITTMLPPGRCSRRLRRWRPRAWPGVVATNRGRAAMCLWQFWLWALILQRVGWYLIVLWQYNVILECEEELGSHFAHLNWQ